MSLQLSVERSLAPSGGQFVRLGHELLDEYLTFLAGRARPNSVLAAAFDLKVFFCFAQKEPSQITSRDVLNFIASQRTPRTQANVVRISDEGSGLSARTVARRLSSISGLFAYLIVRGDTGVTTSPVPRGLMTRRSRRDGGRTAPLVRTQKLLPRILQPQEVDALIAALRTKRDRAMVEAMVARSGVRLPSRCPHRHLGGSAMARSARTLGLRLRRGLGVALLHGVSAR
jgi:integrase/recombinase XerD